VCPPGKKAARRSIGHDISLALQHFPVTHHFLVTNEKTGHTTVVFFRNQYSSDTSVFGALQYTSLCNVQCEKFLKFLECFSKYAKKCTLISGISWCLQHIVIPGSNYTAINNSMDSSTTKIPYLVSG